MVTEENVLDNYINLINMVDACTNFQMDFYMKLLQEKKEIYGISYFWRQMINMLKGNQLLANALPIYSFIVTLTFVLLN